MTKLKKYTSLFAKIATKSAEKLGDTTKDISVKLANERKKVEVKSQISQHERQIAKAYERLGEAYYEHEVNGKVYARLNDVMDVIRSNKKVIALLEEQLKALDSE